MTSWATGIGANTLFVADLEAAKAFYAKAFAAEPMFEDDDSAVFQLGDTLLNLLRARAVPELIEPAAAAEAAAGARLVFTVEVDDVDARAEWLTAAGVTLLNGPMDRPWGPRTASFQDLDGYVWEIAGQPRS
jgi:catechol 2,3-dioxygenase-like lactoylglutathione lyase family enzyme